MWRTREERAPEGKSVGSFGIGDTFKVRVSEKYPIEVAWNLLAVNLNLVSYFCSALFASTIFFSTRQDRACHGAELF